MKTRMIFKKDLKEKNEIVNIAMDRFLPRKDEYPKQIHKAMRHTLFAGGKRIRPYLTIRTFNLFSDETEKVTEIAGTIELIHTYTLIHDDLPEIDNDDLRRGKPTCHVLYGADLALLAGDALLINAIEMISATNLEDKIIVKIIKEVTRDCGARGLIGGQMADIINENKEGTPELLNFIHLNKTVKLFQLCTKLGCIVAEAGAADLKRAEDYGYCFGMAFQIIDDILDIEGSSDKLGKTTGKDEQSNKLTYPVIHGIEKSRLEAQRLMDEANEIISYYGDKAQYLQMLNDFVISREL
jgi:geranylgeranyl diphosphate synthase, type II